MATIKERLDEFVRIQLSDTQITRWEDNELLMFYKIAVSRANAVGQRNNLPFMRSKLEIALPANTSEIVTPYDMLTPISMVNKDTHRELKQQDGTQWDKVESTGELCLYMVENDKLLFKNPSHTDANLIFRYYAKVSSHDLMISSESPWGGKLDDILCDYVIFRAQKADEYDTGVDVAILNEMENKIIGMYTRGEPLTIKSRGWTI